MDQVLKNSPYAIKRGEKNVDQTGITNVQKPISVTIVATKRSRVGCRITSGADPNDISSVCIQCGGDVYATHVQFYTET